MSLFNTTTGTDATATDAGFDVNALLDGFMTVFGFFRKIIDFLKNIFKPIFEGLIDSVVGKLNETESETQAE